MLLWTWQPSVLGCQVQRSIKEVMSLYVPPLRTRERKSFRCSERETATTDTDFMGLTD